MAEEESITVELIDSFYRDGFKRVMLIVLCLLTAISLLILTSVYLIITKPPPQIFKVGEAWRTQPETPINEPYLTSADVAQWVSNTLQTIFTLDFINYKKQYESYKQYFTNNGWSVYTDQLNNYVNYDTMKSKMLFATAAASGAPIFVNEGLLAGRYGWWVEMPIEIEFQGVADMPKKEISLQVLVVRVPNVSNLDGIAINNIIVNTPAKK